MIDEWERKSSIANCLSPLRVNSVAERLYYRAVASRSPWPFVISPDGQREHVFRCHIATTHWHSLTCRVFCILFLAFPSGSRRAIFASQWNSKRYAPRDLLISNNFQQTWTIKYVTIFQDTQNQHTKHLIYYNHAKWTWFNGHQHSTNVRRLEQTKECSSAFYYYYTLKSSDSFAGRSSIHNIHEYRRHHTLYVSFFFSILWSRPSFWFLVVAITHTETTVEQRRMRLGTGKVRKHTAIPYCPMMAQKLRQVSRRLIVLYAQSNWKLVGCHRQRIMMTTIMMKIVNMHAIECMFRLANYYNIS